MSAIHSIHIVRKFGPVGGMENYVWHLTDTLSKLGHPITVICEATFKCGIANLITPEQGKVLPLDEAMPWIKSAQQLLSTPPKIQVLNLTQWSDMGMWLVRVINTTENTSIKLNLGRLCACILIFTKKF